MKDKINQSLVLSPKSLKDFTIDNPILIGEWILKDLDFAKLKEKNYEIFNSKSYSKKNIPKSFEVTEKLYNVIKIDLINQLNKLHNTNFSNRSWEIIFGLWVRCFIHICFERYNRINDILTNYNINKIYLEKNENFNFFSNDTFGIYFKSTNNEWENNLYFEIINFFSFDKEKKLVISQNASSNFNKKTITSFPHKKISNLKKVFYSILKFLNNFSFNNNLITYSYLEKKYEFFFQILLGQLPQHFEDKKINYENYNKDLRKKINIYKNKEKNLENFIRLVLPKCLPICMVESFNDIYELCEKVGYPKKPNFIFTSVSYAYDECFKFYTAKRVKTKIPYFIGQHGNESFSHHNMLYSPELDTADRFISWGYKSSNNIIKGFNFKVFKEKKRINNKGKLLIISKPFNGRFYPHDTFSEFSNLLANMNTLKQKLKKNVLDSKIQLKLSNDYKSDLGIYLRKKILKNFENSEICYEEKNLNELISESRLCVFSYDGTSILENFLLNIPTVIVVNNFDYNIRDEFKEKYLILKKANILFDNIVDSSNHINANWDNISKWWFSEKTQTSIKAFNKDFNLKGDFKSLVELKNKIKNFKK